MHLSEQKAALRESIKERILKLPKKLRVPEERSLCKTLRQTLGSIPQTVAMYSPLADEVDIRPVIEELLNQEGWNIFLPIFNGGKLAFRRASSLKNLKKGTLGILEPENGELLKAEDLDVAIVPGRAFTNDGQRLGRGNGGYDTWIHTQRAQNARTEFIGIALECQVLPELPMEAHDEKVDFVITARGRGQSS